MNKQFLTILLLSFTCTIHGQILKLIRLQVVDNKSATPLKGVEVALYVDSEIYNAPTEQNGTVSFKEVPTGQQRFIFEKKGYETKDTLIQVVSGVIMKIKLKKEVLPPPKKFLLEVAEDNAVKTPLIGVSVWIGTVYKITNQKGEAEFEFQNIKEGEQLTVTCDKIGYKKQVIVFNYKAILPKGKVKLKALATFEQLKANFLREAKHLKDSSLTGEEQRAIMGRCVDLFQEIKFYPKQTSFINAWEAEVNRMRHKIVDDQDAEKIEIDKQIQEIDKEINDYLLNPDKKPTEFYRDVDLFFEKAITIWNRKYKWISIQKLPTEKKKDVEEAGLIELLKKEYLLMEQHADRLKTEGLYEIYKKSIENNMRRLQNHLEINELQVKQLIGA